MKQLVGKAETTVSQLKHDKRALEADVRRHTEIVARKQEQFNQLQTVL